VSESDDDVFAGLGIAGGESHAERLRRKNLELDRALRDDPRDVARWLEFVDLQDEIAQSSFAGGSGSTSAKRALSKGERASTSEVKLAILVRALAVPDNADAEPLILAQLRAAAEVEEPQHVLARWKDALREHPRLTGLWIEYVSWRQTTWATFSVQELVGVFEESFEVLVDAMEGEEVGSSGACAPPPSRTLSLAAHAFVSLQVARCSRATPSTSSCASASCFVKPVRPFHLFVRPD